MADITSRVQEAAAFQFVRWERHAQKAEDDRLMRILDIIKGSVLRAISDAIEKG